MRLILMGAPGSGKGTQAEKLMDEYNCRQISTGVLLREAIESGSELGQEVQKIMSEGLLVSDGIVLDLIKNELSKNDITLYQENYEYIINSLWNTSHEK